MGSQMAEPIGAKLVTDIHLVPKRVIVKPTSRSAVNTGAKA